MPSRGDLVRVAERLKEKINGKEFKSIPRREITEMLREVSGEETTRMKSDMAERLERALLEQGVRVFPKLQETSTSDTVRIFHPGTVTARLVDIISCPDPSSTDKELAEIITKLKGKWKTNYSVGA